MSGIRFGTRSLSNSKTIDWVSKKVSIMLRGNKTYPSNTQWVRPSDWVAMPALSNNRIHIVAQILNLAGNTDNILALRANVSGGYTVDWGDGNVINYSTNTTAEKAYDYSTLNTNVTSEGFKTALIQVYAQNTANNFTFVNLRVAPPTIIALNSTIIPHTQFLEIEANLPGISNANNSNANSILIGHDQNVTPAARNTSLIRAKLVLTGLTNGAHILASLPNLRTVDLNFPNVTNLDSAFRSDVQLDSVTIGDTSKCTSFQFMFYTCYNLRVAPNINTSNGSDFWGTLGVTAIETAPNWDLSKADRIASMFQNCRVLRLVPQYNFACVSNASSAFSDCPALTEVPYLNTIRIQNASSMFGACRSLRIVPPLNLSNVTNSSGMFSSCSNLKNLPTLSLPNSSDTSTMFQFCDSLEEINISIPVSTNTSSMFGNCRTLKSVYISNMSNVSNASNMFLSCATLETVTLNNTSNLQNAISMFQSCGSLKNVNLFNTSKVTNAVRMFQNCFAIETIPEFDTSNVTNTAVMFASCYNLKTGPNINTAKSVNMGSMFDGCYSLTEIPVYNTSNVLSMSFMFNGCNALIKMPNIDTSNVTDMSYMFYGSPIEELPQLVTSKVTNMTSMFLQSTGLTYMPNIDTSNVTSVDSSTLPVNVTRYPELNFRNATASMLGVGATVTQAGIKSAAFVGIRFSINHANRSLSASELNKIYTNLAGIGNTSVANAVGDGSNVVYTTSANHPYIVGQNITVTGLTPAGYNRTNANIIAVTNNTFTVANTTTGVSSGTGTANGGNTGLIITVTNNYGTASDNTTIATNKGWTVSG